MQTVAAGVITNNNQVLLARRKAGEALAGFWEFPGGKIRPDETPQQCLTRELAEELGIHVKAGDIITENTFEYGNGQIRLIAVRAEIDTAVNGPQDIVLSVHDKWVWVPVMNVMEYNLSPADISIAQFLADAQ